MRCTRPLMQQRKTNHPRRSKRTVLSDLRRRICAQPHHFFAVPRRAGHLFRTIDRANIHSRKEAYLCPEPDALPDAPHAGHPEWEVAELLAALDDVPLDAGREAGLAEFRAIDIRTMTVQNDVAVQFFQILLYAEEGMAD